jgi:hypothetical protein
MPSSITIESGFATVCIREAGLVVRTWTQAVNG